jgi:hypothetical protein
MQHIIKKQVIHLLMDKGLDAFYIQQRVSNDYREKILPLLSGLFDAACEDDEILVLDKLELNLGVLSPKDIESGNWSEKVIKNISEQLVDLRHKNNSQLQIVKKPEFRGIASQWIYYMQHGFLPWNVLKINESWFQKVLEAFASDSDAIYELRNLIRNYPASVKRIAGQHSEDFLKAVVETLTAENQERLPKLIEEFIAIISSFEKNKIEVMSVQKDSLRKKLWDQVLQITVDSKAKLKSTEFVALLLPYHFTNEQLKSKKIIAFLQKNKIEISELEKVISKKNIKEEKTERSISLQKDIQSSENEEALTDGIFVTNAGIVLLHPFLSLFFKNLSLVKENQFADTTSQVKAMYLLHYLATGNKNPAEHELVIPKVLCGYPLEEPIATEIDLNEEDLQEAESLLRSAIGQWNVLQDTSPNGLRQGFLQRNGKLFLKNKDLALQIEQTAIDVLLDYLPWNLSMIKMPWLENILKVEWR